MSSTTLDDDREVILDISIITLPSKSAKASSVTDRNTLLAEVASSVNCLILFESCVERIVSNWNSD